jgi:hypothetical protein
MLTGWKELEGMELGDKLSEISSTKYSQGVERQTHKLQQAL